MRRLAGVLAVAAVMVTGCSDDGDNGEDSNPQGELAALLEQDVEFGVDTDCLADKTEELTDEQAEFLIENIDAENTDDFDADLRAWVASLVDCVDDGLASETE
jgi:hypothetical protein